MRIGVVSDTHGQLSLTREAVHMLQSLDVETVLHCGDIGTADVVRQFSAWPTHFVLGNCDHDAESLRAAIEAEGQTFHGLLGEIELAGARVALLHSHERAKFRETVHSGEWDLVCYGHTHTAAIDRVGPTVVLNPGAVYRARPHSVAVVELPEVEATIVNL